MALHEQPQDRTPSMALKQALVQKGYLLLGRFYVQSQPEEAKTITYYVKNGHYLLLEILYDQATREEVACELYRPVSDTNDLEAKIAAIP